MSELFLSLKRWEKIFVEKTNIIKEQFGSKKKSVPFEHDGRVIFLIKIIALNPQKKNFLCSKALLNL